jgi:hypothetical protein
MRWLVRFLNQYHGLRIVVLALSSSRQRDRDVQRIDVRFQLRPRVQGLQWVLHFRNVLMPLARAKVGAEWSP